MDETLITTALDAVDLVPAGSVVTYGDLGALLGTGPRQAGRLMALHGHATAWWRVVAASGRLPEHLLAEAQERWATEGTPLRRDGSAVDVRRARADLPAWADAQATASRTVKD